MFDAVLTSMCFMLESEGVTVAGRLQFRRTIDEDSRIDGEIFLAYVRDEVFGRSLVSAGRDLYSRLFVA